MSDNGPCTDWIRTRVQWVRAPEPMSDSPSPRSPPGKGRDGSAPLHLSPSFYSSTKILMALKSMLPLLGPNSTSWPWPMQRIPSGRACWPVGIHRFDYEEGQRCFSSSSHKGGLVLCQDNGTSRRHVKLTPLCAIIQTFDLTNVFVPSSTSANTSTSHGVPSSARYR